MSCASPISQLSSPSLRMRNGTTNLLSPCRSNVDDPLFSFAFHRAAHRPPSSSSSPSPASSPATARPALTDILPHRYKNSPRSPLQRSPNLLSPRKCSKENWENTQRHIADNGASIDLLSSPIGKAKRIDVENGNLVHSLSSFPSPCQRTKADDAQLGSPTTCSSRQDCDHGHEASVKAFCASSSPSPLKRKRPAKLAIPEFARLASFGKAKQFELPADEPLSSEIFSFEAPMFGVSFKKGRRDCMEDAHAAITNFQGKANQAFFGVFDGHGGRTTAQFAAENLGRHIAAAIQNQHGDEGSLKRAMESGYLAIDSEIAEKGFDGGACSVSAYVKEGHLVVANAGDCMAVLCREGKAEVLSSLHRASAAEERQRIESLGGYVDCFNGVWRVQGTLAITRGFGDINMKRWILAEPQVKQLDITRGCEFLILASDGLWDKVSEQEAVDCVREVLEQGNDEQTLDILTSRPSKVLRKDGDVSISTNKGKSESTSSLKSDACNKLIHKACKRGNLDDITVMVVSLASFAISM